MKTHLYRSVFAIALLAGACGDNDNNADPDSGPDDDVDAGGDPTSCDVTPGAWNAPAFDGNATDALALRAALDSLQAYMRAAEQDMDQNNPAGELDDVADLTAFYEAGAPSMSITISASLDPIVDAAFADFVALETAGALDLIDASDDWTPGTDGGIAGTSTRGLNAGGIEVRQLIDKGFFGGAGMYRYAVGLTEGTITDATFDSIAAAWGSNATLDATMRTDAANYSFGMGFFATMAQALTDARAYAADANCIDERDSALQTFFSNWELSMIARAVHYANITAGSFSTAIAGDDDERIAGLHELSEGLGLVIGFRGLPAVASGPMAGAGRVITDEQIDAIAVALGLNLADISASTSGDFMEDPAGFAAAVVMVETIVMTTYGVSADDIAAYREPTGG